ncbi:hypothetical protein [Okeania sp. SIO1I7]|uniref:hypothetical protein n=1 Tax=Okeania sp. SIO1I7 TaxID=2607772 RepID=UPI0013F81A0B|nr:hypothetical protein [Okeania sp. SIO1I7]NET24242.1 hypothetical protein [Okeania sp. SIO1I7]
MVSSPPYIFQDFFAGKAVINLPIGRKYREFPFIVFRSYSLEEIREKIYSDRYLLTSNELNILNLILCRDEKI